MGRLQAAGKAGPGYHPGGWDHGCTPAKGAVLSRLQGTGWWPGNRIGAQHSPHHCSKETTGDCGCGCGCGLKIWLVACVMVGSVCANPAPFAGIRWGPQRLDVGWLFTCAITHSQTLNLLGVPGDSHVVRMTHQQMNTNMFVCCIQLACCLHVTQVPGVCELNSSASQVHDPHSQAASAAQCVCTSWSSCACMCSIACSTESVLQAMHRHWRCCVVWLLPLLGIAAGRARQWWRSCAEGWRVLNCQRCPMSTGPCGP